MKSLLKIVTFTLLTLFVLAACTPKEPLMTKIDEHAVIDLNPIGPGGPIGSPDGFQVDTSNQGCLKGSGEKKGCIRFAANEDGTITFALNGLSSPLNACVNGPGGAVRVIKEIKLTTTDVQTNPGLQPSSKGDFRSTSYPLEAKYRDDAFPTLDIDTGVVFPGTTTESAKNRVVITNLNTSNSPSPVGRNIWYQVTVKRCSTDKYWVTDPRIENEGMS